MKTRAVITAIVLTLLLLIVLKISLAEPVGPSVLSNSSETASPRDAALINTSGGSITTMVLNASAQNLRWKAYVGNITGKLTLDSAANLTIFDWSLSSVVGEVYATRSSDTVSWATINCSNSTHINNEDIAMNHTSNPDDNISATFEATSHSAFFVGTTQITANSCFSLRTFVNDTNQSSDFEEMVLYDGTNHTNGDVVYATILEQDAPGFDSSLYDFQIIVPENGLNSFQSSTAYYFYVELT